MALKGDNVGLWFWMPVCLLSYCPVTCCMVFVFLELEELLFFI